MYTEILHDVWHNIDNLHCYHNETRPQDGSYIIGKYKNYKGEYQINIFGYDKTYDEAWVFDSDSGRVRKFSTIESWIYLNELKDLM